MRARACARVCVRVCVQFGYVVDCHVQSECNAMRCSTTARRTISWSISYTVQHVWLSVTNEPAGRTSPHKRCLSCTTVLHDGCRQPRHIGTCDGAHICRALRRGAAQPPSIPGRLPSRGRAAAAEVRIPHCVCACARVSSLAPAWTAFDMHALQSALKQPLAHPPSCGSLTTQPSCAHAHWPARHMGLTRPHTGIRSVGGAATTRWGRWMTPPLRHWSRLCPLSRRRRSACCRWTLRS